MIQTLPLAGISRQKQPARWGRLRGSVTGPMYLLSIHHLCSCCNRSRPWLTAVHSQLCAFHIVTSRSVTQEKNQECKSSTYGCNFTSTLFKHVWTSPASGRLFLWRALLSSGWYLVSYTNHSQPWPQNNTILDPVYKLVTSVTALCNQFD